MFVSNLLGRTKVKGFGDLLKRCERIDTSEKIYIDGGAGLGETASSILDATPNNTGSIFAFEPNPDNTVQFRINHSRVSLCQEALSDFNGEAEFTVSSKTRADRDNPFLKSGSSYVGKLSDPATDSDQSGERYKVNVRRLDTAMAAHGIDKVDFVKLDLQGGEYGALCGMGSLLKTVNWMWIEFSNQPGVLDLLHQHGFVLFDTEYLFVGEPSDLIQELFEVSRQGQNSIGKQVFFGHRKHVWRDFERGFDFARKKRRMIQTDLVAIRPDYLPVFLEAAIDVMPGAHAPLLWTIPRGLF